MASHDGAPNAAAARAVVDVFLADIRRGRRARDMPSCASWAGLAAPSRALMDEALAFMDSADASASRPGPPPPPPPPPGRDAAARAIVEDAVAFLGGAAAAHEPEEGVVASSSGSPPTRLSEGALAQLALSGAMSRASGGTLWGHAPSSLLWHTAVPTPVVGGAPMLPMFMSGQLSAGMAFPGGVHRRLDARERTYLDDAAVIHIFLAKRTKPGRRSGLASALSEEYGVTSKAIRDIWKLR